MKSFFLFNLFIICSNSFILSPTPIYLPRKVNLCLKKNDNDDYDLITLKYHIFYNLILYSYIYYLLTINKK